MNRIIRTVIPISIVMIIVTIIYLIIKIFQQWIYLGNEDIFILSLILVVITLCLLLIKHGFSKTKRSKGQI